jgi:isochorismate hydrolase
MTRDPGISTTDDCALVLIDYQTEMFEDEALRAAVEATARKRLIIAGLHTGLASSATASR